MSVGDLRDEELQQDTDKIYESLLRGRAIQTGSKTDEDIEIFCSLTTLVKDKLSDMTTKYYHETFNPVHTMSMSTS